MTAQKKRRLSRVCLVFLILLSALILFFAGSRVLWLCYKNSNFGAYESSGRLKTIENGYHCSYNTAAISDTESINVKLPKDGYFNGEITFKSNEKVYHNGKWYKLSVIKYPRAILPDRYFAEFETSSYEQHSKGSIQCSEQLGIEIDKSGRLIEKDADPEIIAVYDASADKVMSIAQVFDKKTESILG